MAAFKDLIILLPGITGSVLTNAEGKDVWGPNAGAIWRAIISGGDSIKSLALAGDDAYDGVTATRLVPDATIVPGLVKIDGYTHIQHVLCEKLQLVNGENFHTFPYDWRRDNECTAQQFERQALDWLQTWRLKSNNPKARLILIGHSMGGLIARWFIECLGGWKDTRMLVTLGTPHRGSLNALGFIENGMKKGIGPFGIDLSPVLRSCPSVYQLLPIYPCIHNGDGKLMRVAEAATKALLSKHMSAERATRALGFHHRILAAQEANARDEDYQRSGYTAIPLVGIEQPTAQSAELRDGRCILVNALEGIDLGGDGTVPRASATPIDMQDAKREIYAAESHGALQNNEAVLINLCGHLTSDQIDFRKFMRSSDRATLTLDIDDVVLPGDDLFIRARPSEGQPRLVVTFVPLAGNGVLSEPLRRDPEPGWQSGSFRLPSGAWRVTVSGEGVFPVTDLIVVAEQ